VGLHASLAHADEPPSPQDRAAFESGLSEFRRGNYVAAIETWETLLATLGEERAYKVLYNLALAYQAVGDITKAIAHYAAFEARVASRRDASPDLLERAADSRSRRGELEQSYGAIHVHAPRHGGIVLTRLGSSEPRAAGYLVWLSPGPHALELFVGTEHAKTITVDVERGTTRDIDATPPDPPPPAQQPPAPPPVPSDPVPPALPALPVRADHSPSTWLWVGMGATVLSLAAPVGLYLVAQAKRDDADALGPGNSAYAEALGSYNDWRTAYYVSYALPAALGVATVVYAVLPRASSPPHHAAVAASSRGLTLAIDF
jgi:tetratricopeptide (TPR) repeat protein